MYTDECSLDEELPFPLYSEEVAHRRHQRGYLYRKSNCWYLRYSDSGVQRAHALARVSECRTKTEARKLADEFLAPINQSHAVISITVGQLVEKKYFPAARAQLRPSTLAGYESLWREYLRQRLAQTKLSDCTTAEVELLLQSVAEERKLSRTTLAHVKAFLSGVFRFARRQGIWSGDNPVRDVAIPKGAAPRETHAYTPEQILAMLECLPEPAATIVAVAAFTGVRRGELRGLRWEDFDGAQIMIARSWWRGIEQEPKTAKSKAAVPVVPQLAERLEGHRARQIAAIAGFPLEGEIGMRGLMFPGASQPVDLDLLAREAIIPRLKLAGIQWHGWHAFRRGLATNLHHLGVQDKVIQRILRHSNVAVTQRCYIKTADKDVEAAMGKLAKASG